MKYGVTSTLLAIAVVCGLTCTPAFGGFVYVVESRVVGGAQNTPLFTMSGLAISSGESIAAPLAGWTGGALTQLGGSYYAGDTTPVKWGDWAFTPAAGFGGYYDVYGTWSNVTALQNMPPIWTINNAGIAATASPSQVTGGNAWNLLATGLTFNAGTTYKTRLATPGSGAAGKRASFDSVAWAASVPVAAVNGGPANGAIDVPVTGPENDLSWTAGNFSSFFDVFLDTNPTPTTPVASGITATTFDPDSLNLVPGMTYYWSVRAGNVDVQTPGVVSSFTTAGVPEPGAFALLAFGGLGLLRRRRA